MTAKPPAFRPYPPIANSLLVLALLSALVAGCLGGPSVGMALRFTAIGCVAAYPHDPEALTQGVAFWDGLLDGQRSLLGQVGDRRGS